MAACARVYRCVAFWVLRESDPYACTERSTTVDACTLLFSRPAHPSGLTLAERDVLEFFAYIAPHLRRDGRAEDAVRDLVGIPLVRACQILVHLLDNPLALRYDGGAVMWLRRQRDNRAAARIERRRIADHPAPAAAGTAA
jgi:hypothetical protein